MEGLRATDSKLQFKLGSVGGLENAFCSYQLKANLKNNSDCLFGPTIGQRHKSASNGQSVPHPGALKGFLVGCVELGMKRTGNEWFFKMAGGESKYIELTKEFGSNMDICRR